MSEASPVQKFFGAGLMAVGGLMAALCGTCTLFFLVSAADNLRYPGGVVTAVGLGLLSALVGGLPTAAGFLLARWGWRLFRPAPRVPPSQIAAFSDPADPEDTP
jgi:hypothetical protein